METPAAPTVQPQPPLRLAPPEDEPTTAERRELARVELRAAIRRKVS